MLRSVARRARHAGRRRLLSTAAEQTDSDVVIVGGGPAGLALASALARSKLVQSNLKITLVEAGDLHKVREWRQEPGTFSNRVSSITNSSKAFLEDIGAWNDVEQSRTCPIEEMQVWDGISDARITFAASEMPLRSVSELSRLTENLNLQRGLLRHLSRHPEVLLLDKVKVQSIVREEREENAWPVVHLSDGRAIRTRLLVGADGFNSPVRTYAGIQSYGWAYDTQGIVATLFHAPKSSLQGPNTVAYQRFLPTGPIAFLPLSETASTLVWSTKPHLAGALKTVDPRVLAGMVNAAFRLPDVSMRYLYDRILENPALSAEEFTQELAFRERSDTIDVRSAYSSLGAVNAAGIPADDADMVPPLVTDIQPGTVASFPLRFSHAEAYIGEGLGARTVLVGDAAHTIHPLAGQGLNLGLADAEALTKCIEDALLSGGDVGSYTSLLPYARGRYFENHKMLSACDKLHKLYSTTAGPVVWARTVGLEVLNELDTVKAALMMTAGSERARQPGQVGWELAAKGVETLAKNINGARDLASSVTGLVDAGLRQLLQRR
ncbi:ubiquinone biosynthesis monooxygenase [Phanerochaete sordida]|uniref:Ubiquinone biosynthesis monooxygenase COQ6, mitochondrial n=1 Tax=Phanerochaete sordida TaxID=48140 RepID=A0A9P3LCK4_9APHY|nr:ubiquinone biosynthesis monooxygenase [Phanerochaete sordida]